MMQYRYYLDKSSRKFNCPECSKKKFVRYLDRTSGEYLPPHFGRCDSEAKCRTFNKPKFEDGLLPSNFNNYPAQEFRAIPATFRNQDTQYYIPYEVLQSTIREYKRNTFYTNMLQGVANPFQESQLEEIVNLYGLGSIQDTQGNWMATFPFINIAGNTCAIQAKAFDARNHTSRTDFVHSVLQRVLQLKEEQIPRWLENYNKNSKKVTCLFGEHLLNRFPTNPIALVEAPKTAIYGTLYFGSPSLSKNMLWLSTYNIQGLTLEKCKVLEGRRIILFPDLSANGSTFEFWRKRMEEIEKSLKRTTISISNILEVNSTEEEKNKGLDLADFLVKLDWRKFRE
jgi:hypothetical protein